VSNLASAIDELAGTDPAGLAVAALQDELVELHTAIGRLQAQFARRVAVLDVVGGCGDEAALPARAWLRHTLRLTPAEAAAQVGLARRCYGQAAHPAVGGLPDLAAAWADGAVDAAHVRAAEQITRRLPARVVEQIAPILAQTAARVDAGQLRRLAVRAREAADPDGAARADELRREGRYLSVAATFGGMVAVSGILEPVGGAALIAAIDALAGKAGADDQRTRPQRSADALVELATAACEHGDLPTQGGALPQVSLIVDLATLTGPSARAAKNSTTRPAEHPTAAPPTAAAGGHAGWLAGVPGPWGLGGVLTHTGAHVGPATARRICCDAVLQRVLRAPSEPLDLGRQVRLVTPAQRRALLLRDGGCRFPGCHARAAHTIAHHVQFWADGGDTDITNLVLLCPRHHIAVHEGGWTLELAPDATVTVRKGPHTLRAPPPALLPIS
jgi:hypothetical protein